MNLDSVTIEKRAANHLRKELLCPRLNPIIYTDDKGISWDGEIQLFYDKSKKKEYWGGRCPIQVKGHAVDKAELKKRIITYPVSVDDIKVYKQDGGTLYFVVYVLDDENEFDSYRIFYNELLPLDIVNILEGVKEGQKTKNIQLVPLPRETKEKEAIITQFIRDKGLQSGITYECPIRLEDVVSKKSSYVFWGAPDLSFIGNNRPTYLYEKSIERKGVYFPVGRIFIDSITAQGVPIKVRIDNEVYFDNAHIEFKGKGKIKSITFNQGLFLQNINHARSAKLKITQKCTLKEYVHNLKFLRRLAHGAILEIDGVGKGEKFDFDFPIEYIEKELKYMQEIQQLLDFLHVKKIFTVKDLSGKNLTDLHYLYRSIVKKEHLASSKSAETAVVGTYQAGILNFLVIKLIDENNRIIYHDGFDTKSMHCEMKDVDGNRYPSSIYVKMRKEDFLKFDNIYYPEIVRSVKEVKYSKLYGTLVNTLVLEMLEAYDQESNNELLETAINISSWLFNKEKLPIYFMNKMQAIKRERIYTEAEDLSIRKWRDRENSPALLAGFAALLGNKDDYKYYLGQLQEDERRNFLMFPIRNVVDL